MHGRVKQYWQCVFLCKLSLVRPRVGFKSGSHQKSGPSVILIPASWLFLVRGGGGGRWRGRPGSTRGRATVPRCSTYKHRRRVIWNIEYFLNQNRTVPIFPGPGCTRFFYWNSSIQYKVISEYMHQQSWQARNSVVSSKICISSNWFEISLCHFVRCLLIYKAIAPKIKSRENIKNEKFSKKIQKMRFFFTHPLDRLIVHFYMKVLNS